MPQNHHIGCFLNRDNIYNPTVKNLLLEIEINLFEAKVIQESIVAIQNQKFILFDSLIGDWKCQTRTSMLIDVLDKSQFRNNLDQNLKEIRTFIDKNQNLLTKLSSYQSSELQKLTKELKETNIFIFFQNHDLLFKLSNNLKLIGLCFFTTLQKAELIKLSSNIISSNKIKKLLLIAKRTLCTLAINYEQQLAITYGSTEEQKVLTQIESTDLFSMTPLFPSFKHILQKMKKTTQSFLQKNFIFCKCGGLQKVNVALFKNQNNQFIKTSIIQKSKKPLTIIAGYQFPGSFKKLKNILNVPQHLTLIPKEYYKTCTCIQTNNKPISTYDIEKLCIASLTQHPQFINNETIKFKDLELEESLVKKEYDKLHLIPGVNINDMSTFFINHIYVSTLQEDLKPEHPAIETIIEYSKLYDQPHQKRERSPGKTI